MWARGSTTLSLREILHQGRLAENDALILFHLIQKEFELCHQSVWYLSDVYFDRHLSCCQILPSEKTIHPGIPEILLVKEFYPQESFLFHIAIILQIASTTRWSDQTLADLIEHLQDGQILSNSRIFLEKDSQSSITWQGKKANFSLMSQNHTQKIALRLGLMIVFFGSLGLWSFSESPPLQIHRIQILKHTSSLPISSTNSQILTDLSSPNKLPPEQHLIVKKEKPKIAVSPKNQSFSSSTVPPKTSMTPKQSYTLQVQIVPWGQLTVFDTTQRIVCQSECITQDIQCLLKPGLYYLKISHPRLGDLQDTIEIKSKNIFKRFSF